MLKASMKMKLRDFTLDFPEISVSGGETLALLGNNGSGKSTTLKIIAGLLKPDTGHIELNGKILYSSLLKFNMDAELRNIGYMFQNYALFPNMTVKKNIQYGLRMHQFSRDATEIRSEELIQKLSLKEIENQSVLRLSGGQRQRVALARSLAPNPSLLLLDEPLSALDVNTQNLLRIELASIIHEEKIPCILVTHSVKDTLALADRVCILKRGQVIAEGRPKDVVHNQEYGFVSSDNREIIDE